MAFIGQANGEMNVKVVLAGPDAKANEEIARLLHDSLPEETKSNLASLSTDPAPTLSFYFFAPSDWVKDRQSWIHVATCPERVYYQATASLMLRGVDAVVFTVSSGSTAEDIEESLATVDARLNAQGRDFSRMLKVGLAYGLGRSATITSLRSLLGAAVPIFEVSQGQAKELLECLKETLKLVPLDIEKPSHEERLPRHRVDEHERAKIVAEIQQTLAEGRFDPERYPRAPELVDSVVRGEIGADEFRWVGEGAVYDVEEEGPVLYLTSREQNPILMRPAEVAIALAEHGVLPLTDLGAELLIKAHPTTVRAPMGELELREGGECCWPLTPVAERRLPKSDELDAYHPHFHIETEEGSQPLNPAQRRLAEALFGTPLERYLDWLRARGVFQTKVMALSRKEVVEYHRRHGPFAMGARYSEVLGEWDVDGNFLLSCDGVLGHFIRSRAVSDPEHLRSLLETILPYLSGAPDELVAEVKRELPFPVSSGRRFAIRRSPPGRTAPTR